MDQSTNSSDLPLSSATRQLIADAKVEAARLQHEYIGTEHVVLALSRLTGDAAPLPALAVEPEHLYTRISEIIRRGRTAPGPNIERPLTSRTQRALALAAESARELGHPNIGVAHVLVGLMRERLNIAAQVLTEEGLTAERAYEFAQRSGADQPGL